MLDLLRRILHELIVDEGVPAEDVVILTPFSEDKSHLGKNRKIGQFELTTNWDIGAKEIYYTTIHSFKGLESPVIILTEIEPDLRHKIHELMYIACSRARHHLIVIRHEDSLGGCKLMK